MNNVHQYILNSWDKTIRDPNNKEDSKLSNVKLPNKYTTPCIDEIFKNFYYWDTYFTNLGLLADDRIEDARNNLKIMDFFVRIYGFVPNADHLIFGSQPPLFTRGVYDLYKKSNDKNDILLFIDSLIREQQFWEYDRSTPTGLSQFKCGWTNIACKNSYNYFANRVGGLNDIEKQIPIVEMGKHFYAFGESGWDMNLRFRTPKNRFAALEFNNIDLNSILFDAEMKISEMLSIIGRDTESNEFLSKANKRKELMNKYMRDPETGILLDYNFVSNTLSSVESAASFCPFAFGISNDKNACLKLFNKLDNEYGLSCAPYHGEEAYMQWDYPHMWASNAYFAFVALEKLGLTKEAELLKKQYMEVVAKNYQETHKLWEKYNTITGSVSKSEEYETPAMMGWTAGVFEYFYHHN